MKSVHLIVLVTIVVMSFGSFGQATELIVNGGFETGSSSPWVVSGGAAVSSNGGFKRSGTYFMWLGGTVNEVDYAYQTISIPSTATAATLSFYWNINSTEGSTTAYDTFKTTIRNASNTVLETVVSLSNINQTAPGNPNYHLVTFNLLPSYAGQTIRIHFASTNDSTNVTNFRVDDVSVQVTLTTVSSPTVSTSAASSVGTTSATLNGTVNPNGGSTTAYFQYGTTTSYGSVTTSQNVGSGTTAQNFSSVLSNLSSNTTYHYRIVASNSSGTNYGSDVQFTTLTIATVPVVQNNPATNVTYNSATLNSTITDTGGSSIIDARFEWTASSFPGTVIYSVPVSGNTFSYDLTGLQPNTTYTFHSFAKNSTGWSSAGNNVTFTTLSGGGTDYPSATWMGPAATGNYGSGRNGNTITSIIVHTTEGSMASALSRFQTAGQLASSHYIIGTDGTVWQVVRDADTAYHCGNLAYNYQSIGIEQEGWADGNPAGNFSWQTDAQRTALENLIDWLHTQYNIPLDRAHIIGHNQVPSPGTSVSGSCGTCSPSSQWGGCCNHYDPGAWFNWRQLMTDLGRTPTFSVVSVQSAASITTLPQSGAPVIVPVSSGQKFVAYDYYNGYYLVFLSGKELVQTGLVSDEYHWDGWIPATNVTVDNSLTQLEVVNAFPFRWVIHSSPSLLASVVGRTIDGKRYVATGNTAVADGYTWREFYIATTANSVATGWAVSDAFTVIGNSGQANWVFLYYFCNGAGGGSDLETGCASKFTSIAQAAGNQNVDIYLLWDHSGSTNEDRVFHVKNNTNWNNGYTHNVDYWTATDIGLPSADMDTGDVTTLNKFVDFALSKTQAQHYALVIFNHGGGVYPTVVSTSTETPPVITGIAWDDTGNYLSIKELGQGCSHFASAIGKKIDVLQLDACLMQMTEINYEIRNSVIHNVATENEGWSSVTSWEGNYLGQITGTTDASSLASSMAEKYFAFYSSYGATISVVRSENSQTLSAAVNSLGTALRNNLSSIRVAIDGAREATQKFAFEDASHTQTSSNYFLDLRGFAQEIKQRVSISEVVTACDAVISAVGDPGGSFVELEQHQSSTSQYDFDFSRGCYGISIFFPKTATITTYQNYTNQSSNPANLAFCADTSWDEFLKDYLEPQPTLEGDLDGDGAVDFTDYAIFAHNWMEQSCAGPNWCAGADLNKDTQVNILDLIILAQHWLEGT